MMRYLLVLFLSIAVSTASAQVGVEPNRPDADSTMTAQMPSTTGHRANRFFEGLSLGVDIVGIVMDRVTYKGEYQAALQANIKGKILPVIELGYGKANREDDDTGVHYKTKSPFGRIGCDFNILRNKHDDYRLTVGFRYGLSSFDFDTSTPIEDESGTVSYELVTEKMTFQWAEVVLGVDAKVAGPLHMGWSLRLRKKVSASDCTKPAIYAPGYGDATQNSRFMVLYFVSVEI